MATALLTNAELKIVSLDEADIAGLETLFDEQCDEWLALLNWDYTGPSRMIRQVARQRELPGFVATKGGQTIGFAYYIIESGRCSIGDIYVSKSLRGAGVDQRMLAAILDEVERQPRISRIESQCVGIENDGASALFERNGFERFDRYYMKANLSRSISDTLSTEATQYKQPNCRTLQSEHGKRMILRWRRELFIVRTGAGLTVASTASIEPKKAAPNCSPYLRITSGAAISCLTFRAWLFAAQRRIWSAC